MQRAAAALLLLTISITALQGPHHLSLASVEGALRAYNNALAADPKMRDKFLDGLLELQSNGKLLEGYVTGVVAKCEEAERAKG